MGLYLIPLQYLQIFQELKATSAKENPKILSPEIWLERVNNQAQQKAEEIT